MSSVRSRSREPSARERSREPSVRSRSRQPSGRERQKPIPRGVVKSSVSVPNRCQSTPPLRRRTPLAPKPNVVLDSSIPTSPLSSSSPTFRRERQGQVLICAEDNCTPVNHSKNCKHVDSSRAPRNPLSLLASD